MEAEGAVGLSEARDGSPLSGAASSDDADTVVGVSYGMDGGDMGRLDLYMFLTYSIPAFPCVSLTLILLFFFF